MSISGLPSWLEPDKFNSPLAIMSAGSAAGARDYANQLSNRQMELENQRAQTHFAAQQAAANLSAQQQAQSFALEQAKFGMVQKAEADKSAREAARFVGIQGLQDAVAGGEDFQKAFQRFSPQILGDTPSSLATYAEHLGTDDTRKAIADERNKTLEFNVLSRIDSSEKRQDERIQSQVEENAKKLAQQWAIFEEKLSKNGDNSFEKDPEYKARKQALALRVKADLEKPNADVEKIAQEQLNTELLLIDEFKNKKKSTVSKQKPELIDGQTYTDKNGKKAIYREGKPWEEL